MIESTQSNNRSLSVSALVHPFSRLAKEKYAAIMITYLLGNLVFLFFEQPMTNLCKSYLGIKKRNEIGSEDGEQRKRS